MLDFDEHEVECGPCAPLALYGLASTLDLLQPNQIRTLSELVLPPRGTFEPQLISRICPDPIFELAKTHLPPLRHCSTATVLARVTGYAEFNLLVLRSETGPNLAFHELMHNRLRKGNEIHKREGLVAES